MKNAFSLIAAFLFLGCSTPEGNEIKKAEWLLGTWVNHTSRGSIYEHWEKRNPHEFSGKSYTLNEGDTVVFETIRLAEEAAKLLYIPTVANQNDSLPVSFLATKISERQLVFENKDHDFPQIISYRRVDSDSLIAEISGVRNGKQSRRIFPMSKEE